ncbi:MAG: MFS transporter [Candidatus Thioglobus sp.]|jgi:MFS family permease|nr:MFS transporter [Candidatus Pseudothioglobus aerophilus]MBT4244421.1 MFS transporter [Gammaproteobacteria bacterium]MBT5408295.1 MFS transporter [Gammaproteobacteria bacterium]MBT6142147.1 MFS transporter [Gammaproteobacteria bacterium]MBT8009348.1 MFS transporter [Gammaproteobacteria bacterium]
MNSTERLFALKVSLIMSIRMLGLFMLFPVMSVYAGDYDSSTPILIGMAIGIYGLTQALLQIPFGYLSDRFGRKPILIIGLLIFLIGSIIAATASNIIFVVIGRALQGGGAISAVLMAFLADSISEDNRAKANAFVGFQIGAAFMLSLIIGPIITSRIGLSGLFWVIGLLSIIAMLIVVSLEHSRPINYYRLSFGAFKETLSRELIAVDFSVFSLHLILASGFIVMPLLIMENQIVSMINNWQLYLPAVLLSFIGMIPLIIISEKFKKTKYILLLSVFLLIISQIIFYISNLNFSVFLITLTIFFVAFNTVEAILPSLLSKTASASKRGLAMGIFSTSQFLGTFIGGVIGGLIYDIYDLNSVFLFTIFVAIIWWLMVLFSPLKTKT